VILAIRAVMTPVGASQAADADVNGRVERLIVRSG
jgi:hypothetical protein